MAIGKLKSLNVLGTRVFVEGVETISSIDLPGTSWVSFIKLEPEAFGEVQIDLSSSLGILIGSYKFFFEFDHEIGYDKLGAWSDALIESNNTISNYPAKTYKDRVYGSSFFLKNKPANYFFLEKISWYDYSSAFRASTGGSGAGSGGAGSGGAGSGGAGSGGSASVSTNTTLLELRVVKKKDGFYLEGLVSWSEIIETTGNAIFKIIKIQGVGYSVLNELQLSPNDIGTFVNPTTSPRELNYNYFDYKKIEEGMVIDYPKLGLGFIAQVKNQVDKLQTVEYPGIQGTYYPKNNESDRFKLAFGYFENEDDVINYFESISELSKKEFKKLDDLNLLNLDLQTGLAPSYGSVFQRKDLIDSYIKNTRIIESDAIINTNRYVYYNHLGYKSVSYDDGSQSWGKEISYKLFEIETEEYVYEYYLENLISAEVVLPNATATTINTWAGDWNSNEKYMTLEGLNNFSVRIKVKNKAFNSYIAIQRVGSNEPYTFFTFPVRFDLLSDDSGANPNWGTDVHLKGNYFTYNWLDESKLKAPSGFVLESAASIADFKTKANGLSQVSINNRHVDQVPERTANQIVRRPLRPFGQNNTTKVIIPNFLRKDYVKNKVLGVVLATDTEGLRNYARVKLSNSYLKFADDIQRIKELILGKKGKVTFRSKRPELQRFIDMFFRIEEPKSPAVIPLSTKKIILNSPDFILDGKVGMDLTEGNVFEKLVNVRYDAFINTSFYEHSTYNKTLAERNVTDTTLVGKLQKLKVAYINVDNVSKNDLIFIKGLEASEMSSQASYKYIYNPLLSTYNATTNPFPTIFSYNSNGQGYLNNQYFDTIMKSINAQSQTESNYSGILLERFNDMVLNEYIKCFAIATNTIMVLINSDAWDKWAAQQQLGPEISLKLTVVKVGEL